MEVRVFDENTFAYRGIIESTAEFNYVEKLNGVGFFNIWMPRDKMTTKYLNGDFMIELDAEAQLFGLITRDEYVVERRDATLAYKGKTMKTYAADRVNWKLYTATNAYPSAIGYDLVNKNIIAATDTARRIPNMVLAANRPNLGSRIDSFQRTGGYIDEILEELFAVDDIGYRVRTDVVAKRHTFEIFKGTDRSIAQSAVSQVIFSRKMMDNVLNSSYERNRENYKNFALIAGAGEGVARKYETTYNTPGVPVGTKRKEAWVDARDLQDQDDDGNPIPPAQYTASLKQRGLSTLAEFYIIENFNGTIVPNSRFQYNRDYFMGDTVTFIDNDINLTLSAVVTEVETIFKGNEKQRIITFGFRVPSEKTILDRS